MIKSYGGTICGALLFVVPDFRRAKLERTIMSDSEGVTRKIRGGEKIIDKVETAAAGDDEAKKVQHVVKKRKLEDHFAPVYVRAVAGAVNPLTSYAYYILQSSKGYKGSKGHRR